MKRTILAGFILLACSVAFGVTAQFGADMVEVTSTELWRGPAQRSILPGGVVAESQASAHDVDIDIKWSFALPTLGLAVAGLVLVGVGACRRGPAVATPAR